LEAGNHDAKIVILGQVGQMEWAGTIGRPVLAGLVGLTVVATSASAQRTATLAIRGHAQTLHLYGPPNGEPIVVSSGDGGWIHLGPQAAVMLASLGYFVVGFDVRAYLASFTSGPTGVSPADVPSDYLALAKFAAGGRAAKPVLAGISEGAGLSVLAATHPAVQQAIAGVIGLGLGDVNELAWRWKDAVIYFTHGVPREPTFSVLAIADRVAPVPLAAINSTHDEYVPRDEIDRIMTAARPPKRLWLIDAPDHRFSNRQDELRGRLADALGWIRENQLR
jgi:type IV secretory pathway VirJ component